ncbi:hypothetical protein LCGC14_2954160, partial [marine sediment metagenome]
MPDPINPTDWEAHRKDPSAHHRSDFQTVAGSGKTKTVQADVDQPDLLGTALVR